MTAGFGGAVAQAASAEAAAARVRTGFRGLFDEAVHAFAEEEGLLDAEEERHVAALADEGVAARDGDLFDDDNGNVFEGDIDRLATAGVTRGCNPPTNNNFCPDDNVTRGQMAAFLHRAIGD